MASINTSSPDIMVTLKVNFEGTTRRYKLPLRDMGASTLENRVRGFLAAPQGADLLIERYSDSAGAYIVLDPKNISVYKQLYRAAKAKQKLKLRVTNRDLAQEEKRTPKPVTVEDVPEPVLPTVSKTEEKKPEAAADTMPADLIDLLRFRTSSEPKEELQKELPCPHTGMGFEASLLASLMKRQVRIDDEEAQPEASSSEGLVVDGTSARSRWFAEASRASVISPLMPLPKIETVSSEVPVVEGTSARDQWFAEASRSEIVAPRMSWPRCPGMVPNASFAVCCNSCDKTVPDSHYHCSTCDDGDFDLCQTCVDQGITCYGDDHWLIKRLVKNGQIINSTTETIAPKPKAKETTPAVSSPEVSYEATIPAMYGIRTCNCCVQELIEDKFLHCTSCEDFDLCKACFEKDSHGHNPKHAFIPAVEGSDVPSHIQAKLAPGRNQTHNAICDGCDKYIFGIRHKCLDCPDWDYCADCVVNAKFVHPNHRFVPIYEPLEEIRSRSFSRSVHFGICCDGPLCSRAHNAPTYITGIRYKCTVCHDTDFCANCEATPANTHNKTHPLVKFKTPVRHVTVTTTGERGDGQRLPQMGDRSTRRTSSRSTETTATNQAVAINTPQTVVDVKPTEETVKEEIVKEEVEEAEIKKEEVKEEEPAPVVEKAITEEDLVAVYLRDTVADGTVLPPNHVFEQTWVLRNQGEVSWPAGCSVKFVGGDYMGHVDSNHPAGISELVSASESTVCYVPLAPGQEFPFTVLLRTPARDGKIISYWRLTTKDGMKFGHRLWCDVSVKAPKAAVEEVKKEEVTETQQSSQMIFPKLEKESPEASIHQESISETTTAPVAGEEADDFEECGEDDEWDASDDGFMTDEEYDVLDASDEEYLEEQQKKILKK